MIRYILLNPGDIIGENDEKMHLLNNSITWLPMPVAAIKGRVTDSENPLRRPLSRVWLISLAKEAKRGELASDYDTC